MSASTQARILRLAAQPGVHRAFGWLHLQQPQIRAWLLAMLRIPAPTFGEEARAAWFLERFRELGLANAHLDAAGNALAELPGRVARPDGPVILLSAHLDTVFPEGTACEPQEQEETILAPGACDNAAGLSGLLALAAALRYSQITPGCTILFAANVGEEGEGDLRGMRHLFAGEPYAGRIRAALALEGGGSSAVITRALGSRRFRITVTGPGGHSWTDAGAPNPILQLAQGLLDLSRIELVPAADPQSSTDNRTTLNVGIISGGTSVNSIPSSASADVDLRSTDAAQLTHIEQAIRASLAAAIPASATRIEIIGDRPGGALPPDASLLATVRAVDRHLNLRTETNLGSTDANVPLSLGIPAVAIGGGGNGGGIHTLGEWYNPAGRETALRRVLLILLDTAAEADRSEDDALS